MNNFFSNIQYRILSVFFTVIIGISLIFSITIYTVFSKEYRNEINTQAVADIQILILNSEELLLTDDIVEIYNKIETLKKLNKNIVQVVFYNKSKDTLIFNRNGNFINDRKYEKTTVPITIGGLEFGYVEFYISYNNLSKIKSKLLFRMVIITAFILIISLFVGWRFSSIIIKPVKELEISERELKKTIVKLEKRNNDLKLFAHTASHDLKEPLRTINSYITIIEEDYSDAFDDEGKEVLGMAIDSSSRLSKIIEELLLYSSVESKNIELSPININQILNDVIANIKSSYKNRNIEVVIAKNIPKTIISNEIFMIQILQNIISNGIKYNRNEFQKIEITYDSFSNYHKFYIKDNGIGIDNKYIDIIFEPFKRLHGISEFEGTGIGLATVKKVVEKLNGTINVISEGNNKGCTFIFTLGIN